MTWHARIRNEFQRRPLAVEPPRATSRLWPGFALDVRYALRVLRRQPAFALVAIVLMAIGIGATTTLFSVAYGVLLKPLPFANANRLVRLSETREGSTRIIRPLMTNATYLAWQQDSSTLDGLGGWSTETVTFTADGRAPERLSVTDATASLFTMLDARPIVGSLFTAEQEVTDEDGLAVLSFDAWQRLYGGRPDVAGETIMLDGARRTITGVMSRDFAFPDRETQLWVPLHVPPVVNASPGKRIALFDSIGLLKPGRTAIQAAAEGTARARSAPDLGMVVIAVFGSRGPAAISATPLLAAMTGDVKPAVMLFLAAVALLFVAALANISSMQLARAMARRREIAIRAALGAGGMQLARQLLLENLIVGLAGGLAGLLVTVMLHRALPTLLPADFPRMTDVFVDWRVTLFALTLALAASIIVGLLPALMARRVQLVEALVEDSLAPMGGGVRTHVARMRTAIMVGQVAIAAILLVGATLLSRSFVALTHVDRGYEPAHLLTAQLPMPSQLFTGVRRAAIVDRLIDRLKQVPGVTHAASTGVLPLMRGESLMSFPLPSRRPGESQVPVQTAVRIVSADYFATMGMRLAEGRAFSAADSQTSVPAVVVNRNFVRTYLPDGAIGVKMPVHFSEHKDTWEIVGVVDDVRQRSATDPPKPELFACVCQIAQGVETSTPIVVVRTTDDPAKYVPTLRALVHEADPSIALESVMTMDERLSSNLARPRLYAVLLAGFGGFALLIAGVGLFGVLSYSVAQRVREIGVRTALGARPVDIARLIAGQGLAVTAAGAAVGLTSSFLLVRYLGTFLFGVSARDPSTFAGVGALIGLVSLAACAIPAMRAARIDPLKAMKGK
jgi:putative ABC transport system permease protein